jgi:hypothetical protein
MKKHAAIDHFGSVTALADALDVTVGAISQWGDYPPDMRQLQLERLVPTLKAEPECQARLLGLPLKRATDRKNEAEGA